MKRRVAAWLMGMYPRWWRDRYGPELHAVVEDIDSSLRWRDIWDLAKGAATMKTENRTRAAGLVLGASILCTLAGGYLMSGAQAQFVSTATIGFGQRTSPDAAFRHLVQVFSTESLSALLDKEPVYPELPRDQAIERLKRNVRVSPISWDGGHVAIAFVDDDAAKAQRVMKELIALAGAGARASVSEMPSLPTKGTSRSPEGFRLGAMAGCFAGLLAGFLATRLVR